MLLTEANRLWHLRDNAIMALCLDGYVYKYDLSFLLKFFY